MFEARLARVRKPTWLITGLLWIGRLISFGFGILGIGALAVCFGSMWLSALHAVINFVPRALHAGFIALVQEELSEGTLALRIASVAVLATWLWTGYAFWKRRPGERQLGQDMVSDPLRRAETIRDVWRQNAETEKTYFSSDNAARAALNGVPFHLPPANIFFFHTLHLGFIALSVMFCWILVASKLQVPELKVLAWLALFASHDVGVVFGYVYLLKGRLLGFHRARIYVSIVVLSALMVSAAWRLLFSFGLQIGLVLSLIAGLAVLLSVGIWLFELASAHAQVQGEQKRAETVSAAPVGAGVT
jgi:hypothetical protein